MTNKEACEIFADALVSSQGTHPMWRDLERRTVVLTDEFRNALCTVMAYIWCSKVEFGSYDCQTQTKDGTCVDYCLEGEIMQLRNRGVETIGCCCGHCKGEPFIQVSPEFVPLMSELGYQPLPLDEHRHGQWCFKPKTILPTATKWMDLPEPPKEETDV